MGAGCGVGGGGEAAASGAPAGSGAPAPLRQPKRSPAARFCARRQIGWRAWLGPLLACRWEAVVRGQLGLRGQRDRTAAPAFLEAGAPGAPGPAAAGPAGAPGPPARAIPTAGGQKYLRAAARTRVSKAGETSGALRSHSGLLATCPPPPPPPQSQPRLGRTAGYVLARSSPEARPAPLQKAQRA
jgi:hypothetical protein